MSAMLAALGIGLIAVLGGVLGAAWLIREDRRAEDDLLELAELRERLEHARWAAEVRRSLASMQLPEAEAAPKLLQ